MPDQLPAVRLPLSPGQQKLVAELAAQRTQIERELSTIAKTVIAADRDIAAVDGWDVQLVADAVVLTPPLPLPTMAAQSDVVTE